MRHRLVIAALLLSAVSVALPVSPAAAEDCEPKSSIISKVEGWRVEQPAVSAHYKRWDRVLAAFGRSDAANPMTSGEAGGYAARGWNRWIAVRDELKRLEGCGFDPHAVQAEAHQDSVQPAAQQQQQQVVRRHTLQLIGYELYHSNVRIAKNLQEGGVYDYWASPQI
ncbi:hypothetical protein [Candidatus Poriferisodalis sp.]|uniref:hypothetical protein n=1 Tax=Candidatus Poriferisodalis sp. TaxID=3101277 RepID=UPI003B5B396E